MKTKNKMGMLQSTMLRWFRTMTLLNLSTENVVGKVINMSKVIQIRVIKETSLEGKNKLLIWNSKEGIMVKLIKYKVPIKR